MSCCLSGREAREYYNAERDADILENKNIALEELNKSLIMAEEKLKEEFEKQSCKCNCKTFILQDLKDFVKSEWEYKEI